MYTSIFIAIPKVPGTLACNKNRTISIIKIIFKIVLGRLKGMIWPKLYQYQVPNLVLSKKKVLEYNLFNPNTNFKSTRDVEDYLLVFC